MILITTTIICGDCLVEMAKMPENSVDAIVTDPPYALTTTKRWKDTDQFAQNQSDVGKRFSKGFMGKEWDGKLPGIEVWEAALRVAKPGAHALVFGGTRTHHRLMVSLEDAGWEIRDCLMWVYGSGFPKSLDVSKAIDKQEGAERKVVGKYQPPNGTVWNLKQSESPEIEHAPGTFTASGTRTLDITAPATDAAKRWDGWGTALKPAWEPIILCRKPLDGTVSETVLKWGTGAINIKACRVPYQSKTDYNNLVNNYKGGLERATPETQESWNLHEGGWKLGKGITIPDENKGRFPANFVHDGSDDVIGLFPGTQPSKGKYVRKTGDDQFLGVMGDGRTNDPDGLCDAGSAARFFYCAKASRTERNIGLEDPGHQFKHGVTLRKVVNAEKKGNIHPTVKPVELIRYLCRLITQPGGTVLDPFAGSGTTGIAATREGFNSILIELIPEYAKIARQRNLPEDRHQKTLNGK